MATLESQTRFLISTATTFYVSECIAHLFFFYTSCVRSVFTHAYRTRRTCTPRVFPLFALSCEGVALLRRLHRQPTHLLPLHLCCLYFYFLLFGCVRRNTSRRRLHVSTFTLWCCETKHICAQCRGICKRAFRHAMNNFSEPATPRHIACTSVVICKLCTFRKVWGKCGSQQRK